MPFGISAGGAALIGAGISGAASLAGSAMQSGAAGKAAGQATHNLQMVVPQLQQNYNTATGLYQPYTAAGGQALGQSADLLGLNGQPAADAAMATYQQSPGYQWQLGQGLRAIDAGAAASGMLRSGATQKAELTYGQGLANQDFSNYYARLAAMSGAGLTAAGGIASAGNQLGAGLEGNAQSQATTALGAGNAQSSIYSNAASGIGNTVNSLFSNPQFQNWLGIGGSSGNYTPASFSAPNTGYTTGGIYAGNATF
jgi:hypothetical protein